MDGALLAAGAGDATDGKAIGALIQKYLAANLAACEAVETLRGQVKTGRNQALAMTAGGASPIANSDGHVVFEIDALAAAGVTLHVGDVIVSVAGRAVRHRVTHLDDHVTYAGRHWHRWAYFEDEDRA